MGLIALGGTTFGLAEETMAFYPMLIPVFLEAGYDTMTVVATIFLGTTLGTLGSTINPFSTVIASNTAGVNFARALPLRIIMLLVSLGAGMLSTPLSMLKKSARTQASPWSTTNMKKTRRSFLLLTHKLTRATSPGGKN
ncbi:hypothetical protein FD23_GL001203 [Lactobacillus delbrueckii subsp. delbrueckii DSM 20074 = JCM 1012]|nr:hypothetical protein FD23_GL001203 [Lactobacillus delbrueckii subsp. delbrueckii DSM 20074 = JCM 1012]